MFLSIAPLRTVRSVDLIWHGVAVRCKLRGRQILRGRLIIDGRCENMARECPGGGGVGAPLGIDCIKAHKKKHPYLRILPFGTCADSITVQCTGLYFNLSHTNAVVAVFTWSPCFLVVITHTNSAILTRISSLNSVLVISAVVRYFLPCRARRTCYTALSWFIVIVEAAGDDTMYLWWAKTKRTLTNCFTC